MYILYGICLRGSREYIADESARMTARGSDACLEAHIYNTDRRRSVYVHFHLSYKTARRSGSARGIIDYAYLCRYVLHSKNTALEQAYKTARIYVARSDGTYYRDLQVGNIPDIRNIGKRSRHRPYKTAHVARARYYILCAVYDAFDIQTRRGQAYDTARTYRARCIAVEIEIINKQYAEGNMPRQTAYLITRASDVARYLIAREIDGTGYTRISRHADETGQRYTGSVNRP